MVCNARIILQGSKASKQDSDGYSTSSPESKTIWAKVKDVTRSEHYAAKKAGIKAVMTVEVREKVFDPKKYTVCIVYGMSYKIERSFNIRRGWIELTLKE